MVPEYVKCIKRSHATKIRETWCGKIITPFQFTFIDVSHAAENGAQAGRMVACLECTQAVHAALLAGTEHEQTA